MTPTVRAVACGVRPVEMEAAACGRLGLGPAEIAEALGWTPEELASGEARWRGLAAAQTRTQAAAAGWWEARLRGWAGAARPAPGLLGRVLAERLARPEAPEPPRRRREVAARDRAKAVRLLLAETGVTIPPRPD